MQHGNSGIVSKRIRELTVGCDRDWRLCNTFAPPVRNNVAISLRTETPLLYLRGVSPTGKLLLKLLVLTSSGGHKMKMRKRKPLALLLAQAVGVGSFVASSPGGLAQSDADGSAEARPDHGHGFEHQADPDRGRVAGADARPRVHRSERRDIRDRADPESSRRCRTSSRNSASVNGGGGGTATAALHALPSKYTLVLIDGQRTRADGAQQFVRWRLRREHQQHSAGRGGPRGNPAGRRDGGLRVGRDRRRRQLHSQEEHHGRATSTGSVTWPQKAGGGSWKAGISKGFGDLDKDGWNIHGDVRLQPSGPARGDAARLLRAGRLLPVLVRMASNYIYNGRTSNTEPGNITFTRAGRRVTGGARRPIPSTRTTTRTATAARRSPGVITDPAALGAIGESCRFNYAPRCRTSRVRSQQLRRQGLLQDQRRHDRVGDGRAVASSTRSRNTRRARSRWASIRRPGCRRCTTRTSCRS